MFTPERFTSLKGRISVRMVMNEVIERYIKYNDTRIFFSEFANYQDNLRPHTLKFNDEDLMTYFQA